MINFIKINTIKGFEDIKNYYYCDSFGNIYSNYGKKMKLLKGQVTKFGYERIDLKANNERGRKQVFVHVIICNAFHDNVDNKPTVNHINHNRLDNRCENLEFATMDEQRDNVWLDNVRKANDEMGKKRRKQVMLNNNGEKLLFDSVKDCAKWIGVTPNMVSYDIKYGYKCRGYEVMFV